MKINRSFLFLENDLFSTFYLADQGMLIEGDMFDDRVKGQVPNLEAWRGTLNINARKVQATWPLISPSFVFSAF
jgi:hypothetical protein